MFNGDKKGKLTWQKTKQFLYVMNVETNQSKWLGKCPACGSWNSFFEQKIVESKNSSLKDTKYINSSTSLKFI